MTAEIPENRAERKEKLEDNARKFLVERIDPAFLEEHKKKPSKSSYALVVDWLKTSDDIETKVARKTFDNGEVEMLLISKVTTNGKRDSEKEAIDEERYQKLVRLSLHHLEKTRYELTYTQNNISFSLKYDKFAGSEVCMLEVDAPSEKERSDFISSDFPSELAEVTKDVGFSGYRMVETLKTLDQTA